MMPVQMSWLDEPWIRAIDLSEKVTTEDIRTVIQACLPHLKTNPVYFLIDMTAVTGVDNRLFELSSLSEWIYHPNGRWFAYVKPHPLFNTIMKMRQRGNYQSFDTRQEAESFLHSAAQAEGQDTNPF